jgi:hypothetical protein
MLEKTEGAITNRQSRNTIATLCTQDTGRRQKLTQLKTTQAPPTKPGIHPGAREW